MVALARWRARCLGSNGEGQTQGLVVVAHASGARERLARRAPCAAGAAVWSRVDPRARPAPPSSRGGAAWKARPLVRIGGCCPLKRSLQCGMWGERRRGSVWSLSVFSLGIFRPFLGLFHGFLSSMMSIFARLLLWWKRWSIYLRGKINNQHSPSLDIWLMKRFPDASITVGGCCTSRLAILCAFVRCFPSRSSHAACCSGLVSSIMFM